MEQSLHRVCSFPGAWNPWFGSISVMQRARARSSARSFSNTQRSPISHEAAAAAPALVMVPGQLARAKVNAESEKAGALAAMLSYSVAPALVFEDSDAVAEIVTSAKHIDEVAYVIVLDGNGRVAGAHAGELAR